MSVEDTLRQWATEVGLSGRDWNAVLFLYKAKSHSEWTNPRWIEFAILNEDKMGDRLSGIYDLAVIDSARQRAIEAGVLP